MAVKNHNEAVWSVAEAKAKLSEVIERAIHEGPQRITRNGRQVAVISGDDGSNDPNVGIKTGLDLFRSMELDDMPEFPRLRDQPRIIDL